MSVQIQTEPTDQTVLQGSTTTFTATARSFLSPPSLAVTWHRVTTSPPSDTIVQGPTNITGIIFYTSSFTTGVTGPPGPDVDGEKYYAVFVNTQPGGGSATTIQATLTVKSPVKIEVPPADVSAPDGASVLLLVQASGTDLPYSYQWYYNSIAIPGATLDTYTFTMTSALAGTYKVVVTGGLGSTDNASCVVSFDSGGGGGGGGGNTAPTITGGLTSQTVKVGASATFTVIASGTGTLTYEWTKDGTTIAGASASSFTIQSAKLTDAGSYTVAVSNAFGSVSSTAALVVAKSSSTFIWIIVGIVVAIALIMALIVTIILLSNRKKKKLEVEIQKKQAVEQRAITTSTIPPQRALPIRR